MIQDLDKVQWLVGEDIEVVDVGAVGIPVLTRRVDAANARLEFASGAVANITASRIGTEKIRKMLFFQPQDYIAVDYAPGRASISSLVPAFGATARPGVNTRHLDVEDIEPLRAQIEAFLVAARDNLPSPGSGTEGRRAVALALRALELFTRPGEVPGINRLQP